MCKIKCPGASTAQVFGLAEQTLDAVELGIGALTFARGKATGDQIPYASYFPILTDKNTRLLAFSP